MKKTKKLVMSWLLAFCCVITLVAPSVVNAAADDFEIIDGALRYNSFIACYVQLEL